MEPTDQDKYKQNYKLHSGRERGVRSFSLSLAGNVTAQVTEPSAARLRVHQSRVIIETGYGRA